MQKTLPCLSVSNQPIKPMSPRKPEDCISQQTDITDKCSTDTYFRYDYTDADHITHVIVIGGTADDYGYAEYLFDADGTYIFNNMNVSSDTPAWFVNAEKDLGVDAESLSDEAATYSVTEE